MLFPLKLFSPFTVCIKVCTICVWLCKLQLSSKKKQIGTDNVHIRYQCNFNSNIYISSLQYIWIILHLVCVMKIKPVYIKERKYINANHIRIAQFACYRGPRNFRGFRGLKGFRGFCNTFVILNSGCKGSPSWGQ